MRNGKVAKHTLKTLFVQMQRDRAPAFVATHRTIRARVDRANTGVRHRTEVDTGRYMVNFESERDVA